MPYTAKALREEIAAAVEQCEALLARETLLSPDARATLNSLLGTDDEPGEIQRMKAELKQLEQNERHVMNRILATVPPGQQSVREANMRDMQISQATDDDLLDTLASRRRPAAATPAWQTLDGKPVRVLARHERFADFNTSKAPVPVGEMIRTAITGRGTTAIRAALGENQNAGGGFMVPQETGRILIDLARARSVLVQAGAQTVDMESDHLTIARVKTDPTFAVKDENSAFTEDSAMAFEGVGFTAHLIGTFVTASRELAEDAPNFATLIEDVITRALGVELDRLGLVGTEPLGITGYPSVGSTGSVAAISWEEVHAAYVDVQANNGEPNAFVAHPTIQGDLDILTSGDGVNASKNWLGPPPGVDKLLRFHTTNITTANLIVGDFTQMLIGLRQRPLVELTTSGGDTFKKHQVGIKVTWRGDFGLAQPKHFHVLSGITT